ACAREGLARARSLGEPPPQHRLAAVAGRDRAGRLRAAVGYQDALRLQGFKLAQGQFAHLSRADDQHRLVAEVVKDLSNVIDGGTGDTDVALADAGLGADALGHSPGMREQRVEQRARGPLGTGSLVSQLDLAGYLALADELAV